jgi:phage gp16-like protein
MSRPQEVIQKAVAAQRRGLLAKIHIAKTDLGLTDDEYGAILKGFKVESAGKLSIPQMENAIKLFKHYGWRPISTKRYRARRPDDEAFQAAALKERVEEEILLIKDGMLRLPGLVKKICGVDALIWCRDANKLERLLAVIGKIQERELAGKEYKP